MSIPLWLYTLTMYAYMVLAVIWSENGLQNSSDRSIGQRWHLYRHRELSFEEEAIVFIIEASSFQIPCLVELPYIYHRKCIVINYNVRVYIICSLNCSQSVIGFIPKEKFSNRLTFSVYLFTKEWLLFRKTQTKNYIAGMVPLPAFYLLELFILLLHLFKEGTSKEC